MSDMETADALVAQAQRQLEEHRVWLADEIRKIVYADDPDRGWDTNDARSSLDFLAQQAMTIKLRVARVFGQSDARAISVVYAYPDELFTFLTSDFAPAHLRATVEGGHVVNHEQPAFTAERERP